MRVLARRGSFWRFERFYENAAKHLADQGFTRTPTQVKTKFTELKASYKKFKESLSQSGFGVQGTDPDSIKS